MAGLLPVFSSGASPAAKKKVLYSFTGGADGAGPGPLFLDSSGNLYGPTETTIWSTCTRVSASTNDVPIGRPIANTTCYVVDDALNLVPPGAVGELLIGGRGVARGQQLLPQAGCQTLRTGRVDREGDRQPASRPLKACLRSLNRLSPAGIDKAGGCSLVIS